MPLRESVPEQLFPVLAWLDAEPDADPVADLAALRAHLTALPASISSSLEGRECVGQLAARALDACDRFKPRLLDIALPLPRQLNAASVELVAAMLDLAAFFLCLAPSTGERRVLARREDPSGYVSHGLRLVREAFVVSAMGGAVVPPGLWSRAHQLYADGVRDVQPEGAQNVAVLDFKRLLALAALQPESLTARELVWSNDYLEAAADAAVISGTPLQPTASAFWIDPCEDAGPVAMVRENPPAVAGVVYFSAHGISRRAAAHVDWLKARMADAETEGECRGTELLTPDAEGLPVGLTPAEALSLLERMRDRWASPPNRGQPRRSQQYTIQVCAGLRLIWEASRRGADSSGIVEWTVQNESPGGYAVMAVAGVTGTLTAGMPVALRRDAGQPWSICLVRWIRSDQPDRAELGLQLIAQSCTPVTVGFRGGDVRMTVPALILPPKAALRPNQAILAPAGTYTSRAFSLVHDGERVYVAQARVLSLDMQTANVELFQYEIDPYPG
ncbi:MAG: hypothetical protein ROZ37_05000 [Aromatoleum sp.]|jgi:hypothetical protein|uniref:hypothetical protein n=1 Tax=Aromatoleum sp. TaxID=2307007 RepID=UPI002893A1A2|nr:hypothetical protein [Aromatoleum sp.]MDT3669676.1 hypothetical protein [Aromatoleum sp.]